MSPDKPKISIIIPVLNEEEHIGQLIPYIQENSSPSNIVEILIVDGGSTDNTVALAKANDVRLVHSQKGRAKQMNVAAKQAKGDIFYFLHVDTYPPKHFDEHIAAAFTKDQEAGCFQMRFDSTHWLLRIFAWFTRYNHKICRGGDQSLFVSRELFNSTKGFNENYVIFEDNEFIGRLYEQTRFKILPQHVRTSARKYKKAGVLKLQYYFGVIHLKNYLGHGPDKLYDYYKRKIAV